jgi:hypothetical protein
MVVGFAGKHANLIEIEVPPLPTNLKPSFLLTFHFTSFHFRRNVLVEKISNNFHWVGTKTVQTDEGLRHNMI